jgi:hypothetical protein
VEITAPCNWINANERDHWRVRAQKTLEWRTAGARYAGWAQLPTIAHAHITAELHFRDNRARDAHNYYPTLKAIIDGLVDHGLLADDSTQHLTGPDIRVGEPRRSTRSSYAPVGFVTLTIHEVAALDQAGGAP